jgi:hypothetical protein
MILSWLDNVNPKYFKNVVEILSPILKENTTDWNVSAS